MLARKQNNKNSFLLLVEMKNSTVTLEDSLAFFKIKLNILLPYNLGITLLSIYAT